MHASRINHTPRPTAAKGFEDFRQIKHNRRYLMCGGAVLCRIKPIEAQRNGEYGWLLQVTNSITLVSNAMVSSGSCQLIIRDTCHPVNPPHATATGHTTRRRGQISSRSVAHSTLSLECVAFAVAVIGSEGPFAAEK